MKAREYRRLRRAVGSQTEVAKMLRVHPATISRRERGELPIDMEAELAIRFLYERRRRGGSED